MKFDVKYLLQPSNNFRNVSNHKYTSEVSDDSVMISNIIYTESEVLFIFPGYDVTASLEYNIQPFKFLFMYILLFLSICATELHLVIVLFYGNWVWVKFKCDISIIFSMSFAD